MYLVGIGMSEGNVILARTAVRRPVFEHGGGGWSFIQQTTLCTKQTNKGRSDSEF